MHMTFSHTTNIVWKQIPVLSEYSSSDVQKANTNGTEHKFIETQSRKEVTRTRGGEGKTEKCQEASSSVM